MAAVVLADPAGGALFAVPADDWAALDQRASAACELAGIAEQVDRFLPGFRALAPASVRWRDGTRPALRAAATELDRYSSRAMATFEQLRGPLAEPPTGHALQQLWDALAQLCELTRPVDQRFHQVSAGIVDFADANRAVDAGLDRCLDRLGDQWRPVLPVASRVATAAGRVRGVWGALQADLDRLLADPPAITDEFVAGLELDVALAGWRHLQAEAQAFIGRQAVPA